MCLHKNLRITKGWHIFQKGGVREMIPLYGIHKFCKDCLSEGTVQNKRFILLSIPNYQKKN